jgi:hypothetical protein
MSALQFNGDTTWFCPAKNKYNLSLMAVGIQSRGIKLKDIKNYYGLKGRTAADCLSQFVQLMEAYKVALKG